MIFVDFSDHDVGFQVTMVQASRSLKQGLDWLKQLSLGRLWLSLHHQVSPLATAGYSAHTISGFDLGEAESGLECGGSRLMEVCGEAGVLWGRGGVASDARMAARVVISS